MYHQLAKTENLFALYEFFGSFLVKIWEFDPREAHKLGNP